MKTKLRLGIIGAGSVVREIYQHLFFRSQYSGILEVCAVADPDANCRDWFGDLAGIPPERRFASHKELLTQVALDVVQVNTPDHLHCAPALDAFAAGVDVIVPKPLAATVKDAHAIRQAALNARRFLGVDFLKREDPRIKQAESRFRSGRYGSFQVAIFYMLDKLLVSDPNHSPRFFSSPDFAARNTPVSFLTVHMADALIKIVNLVPVRVRATGYAHKLPSLKPRPVEGYDLVDTEIQFATGAMAHILTGWATPNTAWSITVQSGRIICSDGLIDLDLDASGLREIHGDGLCEINPLFRNFERDGLVTGYAITNPGRLFQQILALRNDELSTSDYETAFTPMTLGFYSTLVLEGAEKSLVEGEKMPSGVTSGATIELSALATKQLGATVAREYELS